MKHDQPPQYKVYACKILTNHPQLQITSPVNLATCLLNHTHTHTFAQLLKHRNIAYYNEYNGHLCRNQVILSDVKNNDDFPPHILVHASVDTIHLYSIRSSFFLLFIKVRKKRKFENGILQLNIHIIYIM